MYVCQDVFGLVEPVHRQVGTHLPQLGLVHHFGQPLEVTGNVEERGSGTQEVAVEVLRAAHHQPGVVQEGVELFAGAEGLVLGRGGAFLGLLGYGVQLDGLLHLLYGALEVSGGLGHLGVGQCLGRVHQHTPGVVVLVLLLHLLELLIVVFGAVVVHIVAGGELLPATRGGCVLVRGTAYGRQQNSRQQPVHA